MTTNKIVQVRQPFVENSSFHQGGVNSQIARNFYICDSVAMKRLCTITVTNRK